MNPTIAEIRIIYSKGKIQDVDFHLEEDDGIGPFTAQEFIKGSPTKKYLQRLENKIYKHLDRLPHKGETVKKEKSNV